MSLVFITVASEVATVLGRDPSALPSDDVNGCLHLCPGPVMNRPDSTVHSWDWLQRLLCGNGLMAYSTVCFVIFHFLRSHLARNISDYYLLPDFLRCFYYRMRCYCVAVTNSSSNQQDKPSPLYVQLNEPHICPQCYCLLSHLPCVRCLSVCCLCCLLKVSVS